MNMSANLSQGKNPTNIIIVTTINDVMYLADTAIMRSFQRIAREKQKSYCKRNILYIGKEISAEACCDKAYRLLAKLANWILKEKS